MQRMQRALANYQILRATPFELELLKLVLFTQLDHHLQTKLRQARVINDMQTTFRTYLRHLCISNSGEKAGSSRYDDLLLSITLIKELSTRLESCMFHQSQLVQSTQLIVDDVASLVC